jgi:hypothetical protein
VRNEIIDPCSRIMSLHRDEGMHGRNGDISQREFFVACDSTDSSDIRRWNRLLTRGVARDQLTCPSFSFSVVPQLRLGSRGNKGLRWLSLPWAQNQSNLARILVPMG